MFFILPQFFHPYSFVSRLSTLFEIQAGDDSFEWILHLTPNVTQNAILAHIDGNQNLVYFAFIKQSNLMLTKIFPCEEENLEINVKLNSEQIFEIKSFLEIVINKSMFDF